VTLSLVLLFAAGSFYFLDDIAAFLLPDSWDTEAWWGRAASGAATAFAALTCVLLGSLAGFATAMPLVGPLNELLAEAVETRYGGSELDNPKWSVGMLAKDGVRAVGTAAQRFVIFGIIYIPLLALSLIPVVGLVFTAVLLVYSAFFLTLTFIEPCQDCHRMNLRQKLAWARQTAPAFMGFGASTVLLLLIPCAALVLAPALVTGATLLWVDVGGASVLPPKGAGGSLPAEQDPQDPG
jgi:CysZ protein